MTVASLSLTRGRDHLELAVDGNKTRVPFAQADVDTLTAIIADYQAAVVDDLAAELPDIGRRLFAWLDSKGGGITGLLEGSHAPLRLEIMSPGRPKPEHRALLEAPWELLFEDGFLAGDATTRCTPMPSVEWHRTTAQRVQMVRVSPRCESFIEGRLRLIVNADKSAVARPEERHFLGFRLMCKPEQEAVEVLISKRSKKRIDMKIRELVPRNWGQSMKACIDRLNMYLLGVAEPFV